VTRRHQHLQPTSYGKAKALRPHWHQQNTTLPQPRPPPLQLAQLTTATPPETSKPAAALSYRSPVMPMHSGSHNMHRPDVTGAGVNYTASLATSHSVGFAPKAPSAASFANANTWWRSTPPRLTISNLCMGSRPQQTNQSQRCARPRATSCRLQRHLTRHRAITLPTCLPPQPFPRTTIHWAPSPCRCYRPQTPAASGHRIPRYRPIRRSHPSFQQ
jgi:hypothetical protein